MLLPFLLLVVVCFGSTHTYSLIITFEARDEREKETRRAGEVVRIFKRSKNFCSKWSRLGEDALYNVPMIV